MRGDATGSGPRIVEPSVPFRQVPGGQVNALPLFLTVFVACLVEAVEALTIVLAAGLTREWRSTFPGLAAPRSLPAAGPAGLPPPPPPPPPHRPRPVVGAPVARLP